MSHSEYVSSPIQTPRRAETSSAPTRTNPLSRCWAEVDSEALAANITVLQKFHPEIMAVVKADAYGHGIDIVAPQLLSLGVRHFAVATVAEAVELRGVAGMGSVQIYLMAAVLPEEADTVVRHNLIPFASDNAFLDALSRAAAGLRTVTKVHVEVDTGIGRAGISPSELSSTIASWEQLPGVVVAGICTHFTAADAPTPDDALGQHELFEHTIAALPEALRRGKVIHSSNSPAALRLPMGQDSLFRPGLLIYGIAPSLAMQSEFPLQPVLSLKARVLLVRHLPKGTDISYSRTYTLPHDATIATIGIGYGDGYPRRLSNFGHVLLPDGTLAPIRGRVCMDQTCVEVPDDSDLKVGDTVTLIGQVGEDKITATDVAEQIDTTPHEITTCLTSRVERISTLPTRAIH